MCIDVNQENIKEGSKLKVKDNFGITKYKNIFAKSYVPNWSEEIFVIKNVNSTVPWVYVISELNGKEIVVTFHEKKLYIFFIYVFFLYVFLKLCDKLFVKWKGYDYFFNSWVDKRDIV